MGKSIINKKKRIIFGFIIFLLVMLCCYLISRGIYANNLVRVDVVSPEAMVLTHSVNVPGTVTCGQPEAVFVQKDLPVSQVQVRAGDTVEAGGVLFTCDLEILSELAEEKEEEIKVLKLQLQTLSKNTQLEKEAKERQKSRAAEDYQDTLDTAETKVKRAKEDAGWADEQLKQHEQTFVQGTSAEERIRLQEAYQSYQRKLSEARAAVNAAAESVSACQEQIREKEEEIAALKQIIGDGSVTLSENSSGGTAAVSEEEKKLEEAEKALKILQGNLEQAKNLEEEAKKTLLALTENPVEAPDFSAEDSAKKQWEDTKDNLEKGVQTANRGLEDANVAKEGALQDASRAVEDANTVLPADCTYETLSLELEAKEEQLKEYSLLLDNEGRVCAKEAGFIMEVNVQAGSFTSAQAAFLFADIEDGFFFEAHLSEEQRQYVSRNMQASVYLSDHQSIKGTVDYLTKGQQGDGSFDAAIRLEEGVGSPGESGILKTSLQTEIYGCCIPLEALYQDSNLRDYVFVLVETESILGVELSVQKQYVQVLDKNDTYAALDPSSFDVEQKVVTYATKELKEGAIVRMRN